MSAPLNAPAEGEILAGKYRVERVLGIGGMGVVVAATHLVLGQRVAIKFLLQRATSEVVARFLREARAAVRLKSEHVARVIDVGELSSGAPYMVMEYLEGGDLADVVRKRGPLPVDEAIGYVLQACEGVAEAHSLGIIHRDLKPANLFLTTGTDGSGKVKVLDFGISKSMEDAAEGDEMQLTKTTAVLGSPLYMSPEQLRSARGVTAQSDIWSIGAILHQLLSGQVPFSTDTFTDLILMVNTQPPTLITTVRPDVPPAVEAAILRCLEKAKEARFSNLGELAWALADHGPPDAHAAAERISRTLEAAGLRVPRPPGYTQAGGPSSLRGPLSQQSLATSQASLASSAGGTTQSTVVTNQTTVVTARPMNRGPVMIAVLVAALAGAGGAVALVLSGQPAPPRDTAAAQEAPTTAPSTTTLAPVVLPSAAPPTTATPDVTAAPTEKPTATAGAKPRTTGPSPTPTDKGPTTAPATAAPRPKKHNPLDIKVDLD